MCYNFFYFSFFSALLNLLEYQQRIIENIYIPKAIMQ